MNTLKQAIYRKQSARGRAWEIQMLGDAVPVHEEVVEVLKKDGSKDHVWITSIENRNGSVYCSFRTKERDVGKENTYVPQGPINLSDFMDTSTPSNAPAPVQNAPQSIQTDSTNPELSEIQKAMRAVIDQMHRSRDAAFANAQTANRAASLACDAAQDAQLTAKRIPQLITEALETLRPVVIQIGKDETKQVKLEGVQHPLFEKVLRLANAGINVLLVGEAGCGKSFLAHQIAKALSLSFGTLHCTAGMSESQISGWLLPTGEGGKFEYHAADFVIKFQSGNSLFLLDEIDAADPNVLMFMNGALANGALHIPHRLQGPEVHRGERAIIMAAANTFGHGANAKYQGRNALDGATLDRFYVVEMDYDAAREASLFGKIAQNPVWKAAEAPSADELAQLGEWVLALRAKARAANLRRIVSSRTLTKAIEARKAGIPTAEVKRDTLSGWTVDELNKVGEAR